MVGVIPNLDNFRLILLVIGSILNLKFSNKLLDNFANPYLCFTCLIV